MIEISVNGEVVRIAKQGEKEKLLDEYAIMGAVESFSMDIGVNRSDVLTYFYHRIVTIYNDKETEIKEV